MGGNRSMVALWGIIILALLCSCSITSDNDSEHRPLRSGVIERAIEGGTFDTDELLLLEGQHVQLNIINEDDVTYSIQVPLILEETRITANDSTVVEFHARSSILANPPIWEFDGRLLDTEHATLEMVRIVLEAD